MIAGPGARAPGGSLPNDLDVSARAAEHLRALAREPRPTGGPAAAAARLYCADVLSTIGFRVAEHPFEYSAAVGELGTSAGGATILALILAAAGASLGAAPAVGVGVLVVGGMLVMLAGRWAARHGVLRLSLRRRHGVNLEALRPGAVPRAWLVAHVDSKSQPISLVVRAAGVVLLALAWIAALGLSAEATVRGGGRRDLWTYVLVAAVIGAIPVLASVVGKRSAGALDNASGLATVLTAAELTAGTPVGVLITDAEELGLAGARAWCSATNTDRTPVFNCDGVDDVGMLTLMWTRPRAVRLEDAIRVAAADVGEPVRVIPLIPGVLVDGLAFSDVGREVVTLSRGSLETLRRIHTSHDDLSRLRGTGVAVAARVLARAVHETVGSA
ncbi:MAG TPA: M28 family peptidase [Acidimicrobiia bacterium]|nr:M28 family peptidase [Acidimicrobiia bacterium]